MSAPAPVSAQPSLEHATAEQKVLAIKVVREFTFEQVKENGGKKVAMKLRGAPSYVTGGRATRVEACAFHERYQSAPQIALPPPATRALRVKGDGPWTSETMHRAMDEFMLDFEIMPVFY